MGVSLAAVGAAIVANPVLGLIIVLCLGATVVNGATDAPNAFDGIRRCDGRHGKCRRKHCGICGRKRVKQSNPRAGEP